MTQQRFTQEQLDAFRERLRNQQPSPQHLVQRKKSVRDLIVENYPRIDELLGEYTLGGIAEHLRGLGVQVTESTLRNYIGYARRQQRGGQGSRKGRPLHVPETAQKTNGPGVRRQTS